jgi:hypothetical protein
MGLILYGWLKTFFGGWNGGFMVMYMGVVLLGCGSWVFVQLAIVIIDKDWKSFRYLLYCSFAGGFGFFSLLDYKLQVYLCENLSCWFGTEFIWFLVTDISIYWIYKFYVTRNEKHLLANCEEKNEPNNDGEVRDGFKTLLEMGLMADNE